MLSLLLGGPANSSLGRMALRAVALAFCAGCAIQHAAADTLSPALQRKVQAATFEVVVPKPVDDPLTYEKPLLLELLPYQQRNDKYFSVGTAFAIGEGRYVTAGHVFAQAFGGLRGAPELRDSAGRVYRIAQIEKYSSHEDFVVFDLEAGPANATALQIDAQPAINETVYTVGNALGEGVVVRDGLYTSDTPEPYEGQWKWLRFSAAASPGNSGGPLLDKDGKVIGVVLMKSESENLNFALPIGRVMQAPDHLGRIESRGDFHVYNRDSGKSVQTKQEFRLPLDFADFSTAISAAEHDLNARALQDLSAQQAADTFPKGSGSAKLLHAIYESTDPALIVRGGNGNWEFDASGYVRNDLGNGGSLRVAHIRNLSLLHLRKPDNVDLAALHTDPELFGRVLLKGLASTRAIGAEQVRIVSFGKPVEDSTFPDAWGRLWQLRIWPLAYDNKVVITVDLPVPDGYVSLGHVVAAEARLSEVDVLKAMTDFIAVSYEGTLAQWSDFLRQKSLLPSSLSPSMIRVDYARDFSYQSRRLSFSYTPQLQKISADSRLKLDFGFYADAGGVVWDAAGIVVNEEAGDKTGIGVFRHDAPGDYDDADYKKRWDKRVHRVHPFDAVVSAEGNSQRISTVYGTPNPQQAPGVLYVFYVDAEAGTSQETMKPKLDLLMKNARVLEP